MAAAAASYFDRATGAPGAGAWARTAGKNPPRARTARARGILFILDGPQRNVVRLASITPNLRRSVRERFGPIQLPLRPVPHANGGARSSPGICASWLGARGPPRGPAACGPWRRHAGNPPPHGRAAYARQSRLRRSLLERSRRRRSLDLKQRPSGYEDEGSLEENHSKSSGSCVNSCVVTLPREQSGAKG